MKKYIASLLVVALIIGFGSYVYAEFSTESGGSSSRSNFVPLDGVATTSVVYLGVGDTANTSSVDFDATGFSGFSVDTQMDASSTDSVLKFKIQASQDAVDWFDVPGVTVSSNIAYSVGSTTPIFTYAPQVAGMNRMTVNISDSDHKWYRIIRYAETASSSVWQKIVPNYN